MLSYVLQTFFTEQVPKVPKPSAGTTFTQSVIRHDLVFQKAAHSYACSMMRWHPDKPSLLEPLLRTNEPGLFATQHWANLLWLGLAAPLESFELVSSGHLLGQQQHSEHGACMSPRARLCTVFNSHQQSGNRCC